MGALSYIRDGLINVLSGRGTSVDKAAHNFWFGTTMPPDQIEAAYRSSWLVRQIVDIPAYDQTRAGRDWDADDEDIAKIEAEEKRLGYWPKVRQALIFGRLGGGALFINLGDDPTAPLPVNVRPEQVQSLVPLHRTQITLGTPIDDLLDPLYAEPSEFRVNTPARPVIHASRLIVFKGNLVPGLYGSSTWEDRYWGDSVVQTVNEAVQNATTATGGFAGLIDEAKVDIFRLNQLADHLLRDDGENVIAKRVEATQLGKSNYRAIFLDKEDEWETRQINWAGMPEIIKTYLAIVAGAADIPATRLLGKSPDGMNSTGEGDLSNYFQSVAARQETELRPALERLDAVVLPSAGVKGDASWSFSPLMVMSEAQASEIEKREAETVQIYANAAQIPESALSKSVQNRLIESQRWPGLKEAIEEAEAAGEGLPDDPAELGIVPIPNGEKGGDPNLAGVGGAGGNAPPRRAANDRFVTTFGDAQPRPLYVQRKLLNAAELIAWAKSQGLSSTLPAGDMHVTVLYSRTAVDPMKMGETWSSEEDGGLKVKPGGPRAVERLGENAVVLLFSSWALSSRHREMVEAGGSHDWPEYQPHVTLSYEVPADFDLETIKPYAGELRFGAELFEPLDLDWKSKVSEQ